MLGLSKDIRGVSPEMRRFYTLESRLGIGGSDKIVKMPIASAGVLGQGGAAPCAPRQLYLFALQVAQGLGQLEVVGAAVVDRLALARLGQQTHLLLDVLGTRGFFLVAVVRQVALE